MSREVVAWRAEDAEHAALQVGRRPVQALWPLLRPNFRTVFLPPQRRAGSGVVTWRWRGAQTPPIPAAADLAGLRRRLGHALQDLSVELDHREGVVAGVGSWELHVTMEKLVGALTQATDAQLAAHAVLTESGWLIRSWGFAKPSAAEIETASENSEAETEDAVEPEPVSAIKPAVQRGWLPPLIWSVGAVVFVGGVVFAYRSGWFTPSAIREKSKGVSLSEIHSAAESLGSAPATKPSTMESSSRSAPGGGGGVIGLKPIRAELGLPTAAPLSLTSGLPPATQAGSAAAEALAPAVIPGATVGGMKGGPEAVEDHAGPSGAPAGADESNSQSSDKKGADTKETSAEASGARAGKGNDSQQGSKSEASPKPDAKSPSPNSNKPQSEAPGKTASATSEPPAASKGAGKPEIVAKQAASAARTSGIPPGSAAKEVKDGAESGDQFKEETRTTVVVQVPGRKTPTPANQPAAAEKPKTPAERTGKSEKPTASREDAKAPEKTSGTPAAPEKTAAPGIAPEGTNSRTAEPETAEPEPSSPERAASRQVSSKNDVVEEAVPPSTLAAVVVSGGMELATGPIAGDAARGLVYRVSDWQLRRIRDVVLATGPQPEGDTAAAAVLAVARARAWEEARRRVPLVFKAPLARSGWSFELDPQAGPVAWQVSGGGGGVITTMDRAAGAQISWPDLLPTESMEARLVRADGRELARVTISVEERKVRVHAESGLARAVPDFSIQDLVDVDGGTVSVPLAWRSLERLRWSDARWETKREGRNLSVRCLPDEGMSVAFKGGTLGLVDAPSGWALAVELRPE